MGLEISPLAPPNIAPLPDLHGVGIQVAHTGLRYKNRNDLLLITFPTGYFAVGGLTRSKTRSAPVDWCRQLLAGHGRARACLVNAGNANAFTGRAGDALVQTTMRALATQHSLPNDELYCASTGVIGVKLPANALADQLPKLQPANWLDAARAIMTTDTFPKTSTQSLSIGGQNYTINAIAKGSGMIAPNMGTMLVFMATNAPLERAKTQKILTRAIDDSFNSITVDGDTSTSDTLLLFAPQAQNPLTNGDWRNVTRAINAICHDLALQVVKDGEGAQKLIEIRVNGAKNRASARNIGLAIGNSPLIKTAIAGEDANWGRVVMAVGKCGEPASRDKLSISFGDTLVARDGEAVEGYDETPVAAHLKTRHIIITTDVGVGKASAIVYSCDLTHGYIDINADYRS